MNCDLFNTLSPREKSEYLGKIILAVQADDSLFTRGLFIIGEAERKGIYDRVNLHDDAAALADIAAPIENGPADNGN